MTKREECGLPWLIHTTVDDPFYKCCCKHDADYQTLGCASTKDIDLKFLKCCLKVAKTDKPLRARAWLYYRLARAYGILRYAACRCGIQIGQSWEGSCEIKKQD